MRPLVALVPLVLAACADSPTGEREPVAPGFLPPVDGSPRVANVFDHQLPFWARDDNGYLRTWWGERVAGIDGHDGYDFIVPTGTPVRAVTDGVVMAARAETPWHCPLLDRTVSGLYVRVRHRVASGSYETLSLHLDRIDVAVGDRVRAGQRLGLSGNTGCSTGPHLHFEVHRLYEDGRGPVVVDPYGWDDAGNEDPWAVHPEGAPSHVLWKAGATPPLYSEARWPLYPELPLGVGILRVRWMGVRDSTTPSNEFIDVALRSPGTAVYLEGWQLRTQSGAAWTFPQGTVLSSAQPVVRVYSGAPIETGSLGMGMARGVIRNLGDCVVLQPTRAAASAYTIRQATCNLPASPELRADPQPTQMPAFAPLPEPRDAANPARSPQ